MQVPNGPHIRTIYYPDGTMKKEPLGFGGKLCEVATAAYGKRQGRFKSTPTSEADDPSVTEVERERERA